MTAASKSKTRPRSLASGRPPGSRKEPTTLSSKATRTIIRSHHQLHKALADAEKAGDEAAVTQLRQQIQSQGGLKKYQDASLQGQSRDRGGDTSKVLLQWLSPQLDEAKKPFRLLEVGALSTTNACSRHSKLEVTRIDLNSQAPGIEQQDFMERPLPDSDDQCFDVISLSLVVNYVPSPEQRGEMLLRTTEFLSSRSSVKDQFPCLFLVLPAPCITNSRYLDQDLLLRIMNGIGYELIEQKLSPKLHYSLWRFCGELKSTVLILKREVNRGRSRNNFCIVVRKDKSV